MGLRQNWNDGQEVTFQDLNDATKCVEKTLFERVLLDMLGRVKDAFFEDSFKCNYVGATTVQVKAGNGFQEDVAQVSPESTIRHLFRAADGNVSLAAPDGSNPRIDIISVKATLATDSSASRKKKDASTGVVSTVSLVTRQKWEADVVVTTGTPAGSPAVPSTPAGYIKLAEILVSAATGVANQAAITDRRTKLPGREGQAVHLDYEVLVADPDSPPSGKVRVYWKDGLLKAKTSAGVVSTINQAAGIVARRRVATADSPVTVLSTDYIIELDLSGGNIVLNMPAVIEGKPYIFKVVAQSGSFAGTITRAGSDTVEQYDGSSGNTLALDELGQAENIYGNATQTRWYRG